ncbi:xylose isomerase-like protein [Peziza echinospora]|nr:xylose isomerase-like protein [Peziza echinospora]
MAALPFAARNPAMKWLVGAHVSAAKGVQNAVSNSTQIGGNAFALFLKSQRKWESPPLKSEDISAFKQYCINQGYDPMRHVLPHGNYLINLAQMDEKKHQQAYDCFVDDLKRCEQLGIGLYNFHPGSCLTNPRPASILRLAQSLNKAHRATSTVKTVLENMAGHGSHLGSTLEDLRDIISSVDNKARVGVCIDTCHAFAAGYDLRTQPTFDKFWEDFDRIVGREYLVALHLNDSKAPLGAKRDLHESIGAGYLGLEAFRLVMNRPELQGIPMVLETPILDPREWASEVKLLESLVGMKGTEPEFLENVRVLQEKGRGERARVGDVVQRREEKEEKKKEREEKKALKRKDGEGGAKKKARGKKAVQKEEEEEEEEVSGESELSSAEESEADNEDEEDGEHKCNHGEEDL